MAIHNIVLDPDGDILITMPGALPSSSNQGLDSKQPKPSGVNPDPREALPGGDEKSQIADKSGSIEDQWHFRASTKHLSLASTYFKKMMSGPWREANHVHDDGLFHTNLDGFDPDAVSIILNIVHGLNRRVPRTVDLSFLAEIARIVDYFDCHQALHLYASLWIEHLVQLNWESQKDIWDRWIAVAGVFQYSAIFTKWTRIAIIRGLNCAPILELPLLSCTYYLMDNLRQDYLGQILDDLYDTLDRMSQQQACSKAECDAILLGTLLRHMRTNLLPISRPTRSYEERLKISYLVEVITSLRRPAWFSEYEEGDSPQSSSKLFVSKEIAIMQVSKDYLRLKSKRHSGSHGIEATIRQAGNQYKAAVVKHDCGFDNLINKVKELESAIRGLDLKDDLAIQPLE